MADRLIELAERCEKATGPNYALEEAVSQTLGIPYQPWTSSLDAAAALVPEGWRYGLEQAGAYDGNGLSGASRSCCDGSSRMIAALYVQKDGCYYGLPSVDPWDEQRDARLYDGPYPVVAHPPCQRWGRFWGGNPMQQPRLKLGDDGGCFAAALSAVRRWGGVIEHPEASHAWSHFGLNKPPKEGRWIVADFEGGWTCCVEQGHYGHLSRKATWLYAHSVELPELIWGPAKDKLRVAGAGFHTKAERAAAKAEGRASATQLPTSLRNATPIPFRDLLISIARTAKPQSLAA